jgi:hypothetical protein
MLIGQRPSRDQNMATQVRPEAVPQRPCRLTGIRVIADEQPAFAPFQSAQDGIGLKALFFSARQGRQRSPRRSHLGSEGCRP